MILINKDTTNTIALSLSNNVTITGSAVYFLFKFTNAETRDSVLFTGADTSTNLLRYNKFEIVETGSTFTNLTASTINLEPNGWWDYEAYQMTGQTNTSLTGVTGNPLETGKVFVSGITITNGMGTVYTGQSENKTIYYKR